VNVDKPHDIVDEAALRRMNLRARVRYRPVPVAEAARLHSMTEGERAAWLAAHPLPEADLARIHKAIERRRRREERRQK